MEPLELANRFELALHGKAIYGDDFSEAEIANWYADEEKGYASLPHLDSMTDVYVYHAIDRKHFWPHLGPEPLSVLGLGSAYGSEFRPVADKIQRLTIVEPAEKFWRAEVAGIPAKFVKPSTSGILPFDSDQFDLATAFGVLHHIPNVSTVLRELVRTLKPGGLLVVREPITSMGDWRRPRRGLTARERGLPWDAVSSIARRAGCTVVEASMIGFGPLVKAATRRPDAMPWNSSLFVGVDGLLSRLSSINYSYHRTSFWRRFAPTMGVWVLQKGLRPSRQ